jgi:hypothetical protein
MNSPEPWRISNRLRTHCSARGPARTEARCAGGRECILGKPKFSQLRGLCHESFYDPHLLANPKLHAKIFIVVLLTIYGIVVEKFCLPAVMRNRGRPLFACLNLLERSEVIAIAAISAVSWYFVVALGVVKELNFAVGGHDRS